MKLDRIDEAYLEKLQNDVSFARKCIEEDGLQDGLAIYFEIENADLEHLFPNKMTTDEAAAAIVAAADQYIAVRDHALATDTELNVDDVRAKLTEYLVNKDADVMEAIHYVAALRVIYEHVSNPGDAFLAESDIYEELGYLLCVHPDKTAQEHLDELFENLDPTVLNGFLKFAANQHVVDAVMNGSEQDRMFWDHKIDAHCREKEEIALIAAAIYNDVAQDPEGDIPADIDPAMLTTMVALYLDSIHMEAAEKSGAINEPQHNRWKRLVPYILGIMLIWLLFAAACFINAFGGVLIYSMTEPLCLFADGMFGLSALVTDTVIEGLMITVGCLYFALTTGYAAKKCFAATKRLKEKFRQDDAGEAETAETVEEEEYKTFRSHKQFA